MSRAQRILAVAYGGGHIVMMLPVLRALREQRPDLDITLLALTTAARVARDAGETPLGYADLLHLLSPGEQTQALNLGRALQPGNTHPDISEAETVAYLGINAWDLQQQLGTEEAQTLLAAKGRHGFYPLHFFRSVLNHLQPDLVLATNSPRSEQAVVDAATEAGIPSLALLDLFAIGAPPPEARERTSPPSGEQKPRGGPSAFVGDAFAARTRHPSRVCVLSEAVRDNLIRAGWPPERIAVTGNPAFDALGAPQTHAAGLALRAELGAPQRTLILLALQPEPATHPASPGRQGDPHLPERVLQACIDSVRPHPDWTLIVRPHPSQPSPALPGDPQLRVSAASEPLHPLLHAVDAVITGTSTVALEAHLTGRRVLQLLDSIAAPAMPFLALGVADAACHLSDLPQTLAALLAQPSMERAAVRDGPTAGPPQGGQLPLPTFPTTWGRSGCSLSTCGEGRGGRLPLPTSPTSWGRSDCSLSTCGEGRGGRLPLPTSPTSWGRSDCSLSTCGEGRGGDGALGGQRGQSPSVGAPSTAADRVSKQALALLAAHPRPTPPDPA
ncbi:MAG: UDP-glycosyltransferase [Thiomonas sp.]|nr:UDP-glycosyltransferase [Thiomonas sp.]